MGFDEEEYKGDLLFSPHAIKRYMTSLVMLTLIFLGKVLYFLKNTIYVKLVYTFVLLLKTSFIKTSYSLVLVPHQKSSLSPITSRRLSGGK